ncbi:MAG: RNA 2',3'-cyclic phosphodiesterase [Caldilineaceae bacterium]
MTTKRTFIAIEFPNEVIRSLQRYCQTLRTDLERQQLDRVLRFVSPRNIHLTLRFLGDTTPEQVDAITAELTKLTSAQPVFELTLRGLGCFPSKHQPNLLWTDVQCPSNQLNRLQQPIEAIARAAGFAAETKAFKPHITVARVERSASSAEVRRLGSWLDQMLGSKAVNEWSASFQAQEISFIESSLQPGGSQYNSLGKFSLLGKRSGGQSDKVTR